MDDVKNPLLQKRKSFDIQKIWPYIFVAPYIIAFGLFNLYPTLYSLFISFFNWNGIAPKQFVGFQNYITLLTKDTLFWKSLGNTIAITAISIPVQIILGLLAAALLFKITYKRIPQIILFIPYIIAPIAIGAIFSNLFDWQYGYVNELLIAMNVITEKIYWLQSETWSFIIVTMMQIWRHLGYCMVIYLAGMTAISPDVYEAAKIDGANSVQTFFRITVPQLRSLTVFLVLTSIINGLQLYEMPKQLYAGSAASFGGPNFSVLTVIWKFVEDAFGSKMALGYGATLCYVLFVFILIISLLFNKVLSRGDD